MALGQVQQQRQMQSLAMTPELQQSLKMLQLSSLDLAEFINAEMEKNPLLSEGDDFSEAPLDAAEYKTTDDQSELLDYDYSQSWDDVGTGGSRDFSDENDEFDRTISGEKTLYETLIEQFFIDEQDQTSRLLGVYMMDMLDDAGYFTGNVEDIADNFGCDAKDVEAVLKQLQKLEPTGIFARNLSECLRLQLEERNHLDPMVFTVVSNLDLLAAGRFDSLCKLCDCDKEDLIHMIAEIKSLNPKPLAGYAKKEFTPAQPDIIIRKKDDGFGVEVNSAALPKVLVDRKYYTEITSRTKSKDEKIQIKNYLHSANFLVKALEQRAETMLKTAAAIVKFQEEFFKYGIKYLKPLTLSKVAEEIEMHESTISRVTSNKYMVTPRGTFEMKFFFTSGVANSGGEIASTSVKENIKELISGEDKQKPLSDDALAELLKKRGIKISRRTVMKYRESMNISSSYERKTFTSISSL